MSIDNEFLAVDCERAFSDFVSRHGFRKLPVTPTWNLGEYEAELGGTTYRIGYRWYDPSSPYSIRKDIHKAQLSRIDATGGAVVLADIAFEEG